MHFLDVCWSPHGAPGAPQGDQRKREAGAQLRVRAGLLGINPAGFPTAPQGGRRETSGNARLEHNCGSARGLYGSSCWLPHGPPVARREASGNARLEHNCGSAQGFWAETLRRKDNLSLV